MYHTERDLYTHSHFTRENKFNVVPSFYSCRFDPQEVTVGSLMVAERHTHTYDNNYKGHIWNIPNIVLCTA